MKILLGSTLQPMKAFVGLLACNAVFNTGHVTNADSIDGNVSRKPSPKPYTECDKPGDEFFYLVQQWPPGFCATTRCEGDVPQKFTIHGLWPNYCQTHSGHAWPEFCTREDWDKEALSDLLPRMEDNWISLTDSTDDRFWQHEWDKHGTCATSYKQFGLSSQHQYFKTTLDLAEGTHLQDVLADANILPGGSYSVREIEEALTQGLGGQAFLNCERGNKLVEIYVCFNQQLEYVPCSRQGDCSANAPVHYIAIDGLPIISKPLS